MDNNVERVCCVRGLSVWEKYQHVATATDNYMVLGAL